MESGRLLKALGLFVVLGVVFSGTVGLATATDGEEAAVLVPAPRPGDAASYVVKEVVEDPDVAKGEIRFDWARLAWLPEEVLPDDTGVPQHVQPARWRIMYAQGTPYEQEYVRHAYYAPDTGEAVLHEMEYGREVQGSTVALGLGGAPAGHADIHVRDARGPKGFCGARTDIHDAPQPPRTMEVQGYCRDFRDVGDEETTTYRLVERTTWRDRPAVTYEATEGPGYHLTYAEGIPFPVHLELGLGEHIYEPYTVGRHFELELRGYDAGDEAYPDRVRAPSGAPLPLADRVPDIHIEEAGLTGFTLRTAFDAAMADTASPRMADFMDRPGAYLAAAWKNVARDGDGWEYEAWTLYASDGDRWLAKRVSAEARHDLLDLAGPGRYTVQDYTYDIGMRVPAKDALPDKLPLVSAALARSTLYHPIDAPNIWGFTFFCDNEACTRTTLGVRAGQEHLQTGTPSANTQGNAPANQYTVFFTELGLLSHTWSYEMDRGSEPLLPVASSDGGVPPAGEGPEATAAWTVPSASAAAGAGFLALLAAAAYYFWPGLKLGALGLFSRIRDDRVLEHPQRRRIHDAIQAAPGIHFQELARRVETGRGALEHHVRKIEQAGLVTRARHDGYVCFFPRGAVDRHVMAAAPLLKADGSRRIMDALATHPGISGRELAGLAGMAASTVHYHVKRLREAGLLLAQPGPNGSRLHVTPTGREAMARMAA